MRKKCIHHNKPKRGPYPMPMRKRVDYQFKDDAAREKALMRHPWYRKKKMWDKYRASLPAENRLDVA
jgi:hypothetical protein